MTVTYEIAKELIGIALKRQQYFNMRVSIYHTFF